MAEPLRVSRITPEEYLAFERNAPERHELIDGEIVAMSGGTFAHSLIAGNLTRVLGQALHDQPCFVLTADMRVKVQVSDLYTYPDVSVACGELRFDDQVRDTLLNPVMLVEVLSDSSERYDRGEKFARYRTIPTLSDYVLIAQHAVAVEHFERQGNGTWLLRPLGPGETLRLASLGVEVPLSEIYLKVFPEAAGELS